MVRFLFRQIKAEEQSRSGIQANSVIVWTKKQIPFSRFLQTTAFLGLNRIATLLGYLEVPGALSYETANHSIEENENIKNENDLTESNLMLATMRLNHFMSDPSNLGAASLELGILTSAII